MYRAAARFFTALLNDSEMFILSTAKSFFKSSATSLILKSVGVLDRRSEALLAFPQTPQRANLRLGLLEILRLLHQVLVRLIQVVSFRNPGRPLRRLHAPRGAKDRQPVDLLDRRVNVLQEVLPRLHRRVDVMRWTSRINRIRQGVPRANLPPFHPRHLRHRQNVEALPVQELIVQRAPVVDGPVDRRDVR